MALKNYFGKTKKEIIELSKEFQLVLEKYKIDRNWLNPSEADEIKNKSNTLLEEGADSDSRLWTLFVNDDNGKFIYSDYLNNPRYSRLIAFIRLEVKNIDLNAETSLNEILAKAFEMRHKRGKVFQDISLYANLLFYSLFEKSNNLGSTKSLKQLVRA